MAWGNTKSPQKLDETLAFARNTRTRSWQIGCKERKLLAERGVTRWQGQEARRSIRSDYLPR